MRKWQDAVHAGKCFHNATRERDHLRSLGADQQLDALLWIHLPLAARISNGFNQCLGAREFRLGVGVNQRRMRDWPR